MTPLANVSEDIGQKKLSLVIKLRDSFSKAEPIGDLNISLLGRALKGKLASGSFFVYSNLAPGNYRAIINSENYFPVTSPVLTAPQNLSSIWTAELLPLPGYHFPKGKTLVRGFLKATNGGTLPGASLSWPSGTAQLKAATTNKGEFVIYFGVLSEDNVVKSGDIYYVKGEGGGTELRIKIEYGKSTNYYLLDKIVVGKTNLFDIFSDR